MEQQIFFRYFYLVQYQFDGLIIPLNALIIYLQEKYVQLFKSIPDVEDIDNNLW